MVLEIGFNAIKEGYIRRSSFLGKIITIQQLNQIISGVAETFTDDGGLILKTENGEEKLITAGEMVSSHDS